MAIIFGDANIESVVESGASWLPSQGLWAQHHGDDRERISFDRFRCGVAERRIRRDGPRGAVRLGYRKELKAAPSPAIDLAKAAPG